VIKEEFQAVPQGVDSRTEPPIVTAIVTQRELSEGRKRWCEGCMTLGACSSQCNIVCASHPKEVRHHVNRTPLAVSGEFCWPPVGNSVGRGWGGILATSGEFLGRRWGDLLAVYGEILMTVDNRNRSVGI